MGFKVFLFEDSFKKSTIFVFCIRIIYDLPSYHVITGGELLRQFVLGKKCLHHVDCMCFVSFCLEIHTSVFSVIC